MSTITINLNDAIQRLRRAGFDEEEVLEILRVLPDTKDEFSEIRFEFRIVKWAVVNLYILILVLILFPRC